MDLLRTTMARRTKRQCAIGKYANTCNMEARNTDHEVVMYEMGTCEDSSSTSVRRLF